MNWHRDGQHDPDMRFKAVTPPRINPQPTKAHRLDAPVLPPFPERLRWLVEAAYAAHGGAKYMKLSDWRDLELELKRKMEI